MLHASIKQNEVMNRCPTKMIRVWAAEQEIGEYFNPGSVVFANTQDGCLCIQWSARCAAGEIKHVAAILPTNLTFVAQLYFY